MMVADTLCTFAWRKHKKLVILFAIEWLSLILIGIFSFLFIGGFIQGIINQALVMSPQSDLFDLWKSPPVEPIFKIYMFNYTNVDLWLSGKAAKLNVEDVGPYSYREIGRKQNVAFHDDDTISFDLVKEYHYFPEESVGNPEEDWIYMPNIPLFSAGSSMKEAGYFTLMGFKAAIDMLGDDVQPIFVKKSVRDIIWGYDDKLTAMGRAFLPADSLTSDQFGLMVGKNNSVDKRYRVFSGKGNLVELGQVRSLDGQANFNVWPTKECDKISGGDGSFMTPNLDFNSKLEILVPDLCRKFLLIPVERVKVSFMEALRFVPDPDLFNYNVEKNDCFCPANKEAMIAENGLEDGEDLFSWFSSDVTSSTTNPVTRGPSSCTGKGIFHVGPCKFGAPLIASWPHFYQSDPQIKDVNGLNPDAKKHSFHFDVQPDMGIGVSAKVTLQLSLKMEKTKAFPHISALPGLKNGSIIAPIMWFETLVDHPPENLQFMLKEALSTGPNLAKASVIMSFITVVFQLMIFLSYLLWSYQRDTN